MEGKCRLRPNSRAPIAARRRSCAAPLAGKRKTLTLARIADSKALKLVCVVGMKKKVLVCGVFDLLHLGHLWFFTQAKRHGRHLTVLVARDSTVLKAKKRLPFFKERERMRLLSSLKIVDRVVLGDKKSMYQGVLNANPDVLVLGYDQVKSAGKLLGISNASSAKEIERKFLEKGLRLKVVRLEKGWMPERFKSTKVKVYLKVR